jgi:hypothetical protein
VLFAHAGNITGGVFTIGQRTWSESSVARAEGGYGLSIGDAQIDLSDLDLGKRESVTVPVALGIGRATVIVPKDLPVEVWADLSVGDIQTSLPSDWSVERKKATSVVSTRGRVRVDRHTGSMVTVYADDDDDDNSVRVEVADPPGASVRDIAGVEVGMRATSGEVSSTTKPRLIVNVTGGIGQLVVTER